MEITRNQITAVVLILLFLWVYLTWDDKENFMELPPRQWTSRDPRKWGEQVYYNNDTAFHPAVPSIVNYDNANYKIPPSSLRLLEEHYNKQMRTQQESQQNLSSGLPVPHNIHSGQTSQVAGTENINQTGAPLDEVLEQELSLMKPMQELRQGAMGEMESRHSSHDESILQELRPEMVQAEVSHEIRPQMYPEMESHANVEMHVRPETKLNLGQEIRPEVVPELHPEFLPEMRQRQIPQEEHHQSQNITASLMPGMVQKAELEEKQLNDSAFVIKIRKPKDRNLTIAIIILVLLVAFIYNTNDY